jgi:Spy/CpxP family protein refolding chaperone
MLTIEQFYQRRPTMKRILTLCLGATLLVGAAAFAAGTHGGGWKHPAGPGEMSQRHEEFLAQALGLTADQKAAAAKLHGELAVKAQPLMEQHHQQMEEIEALLDGGNPDPAEIGQKMIASHATGQQLKAMHEDFMARFSTLLNADQLAKFNKFKDMHSERHSFGVPPGPGF